MKEKKFTLKTIEEIMKNGNGWGWGKNSLPSDGWRKLKDRRTLNRILVKAANEMTIDYYYLSQFMYSKAARHFIELMDFSKDREKIKSKLKEEIKEFFRHEVNVMDNIISDRPLY